MSLRYTNIWRNKWQTAGATSFDDMIASLQQAIQLLEDMKADGITANFDNADDDYIFLYTEDEALAEKYGFQEDENEVEDDEEEDQDVEEEIDDEDQQDNAD